MLLYYLIFLLLLFLCVGQRSTERGRLLTGCTLLFLLAAFRAPGIDSDSLGYVDYYNYVLDSDFSNVEFTFIALSHFVDRQLGSPIWLFVIYAFLGMSLKYVAIDRLTEYKALSLLFYYADYFPLWEMTQIRVAVAGGFMLVSVPYLVRRQYLQFALLYVAAVLFHVSALTMLLFVAIKPHTINKWVYAVSLPLLAALALAKFDLVSLGSLIPMDLVTLKLGTYEADAKDKIFDLVFLSRCALAYFLLFNSDALSKSSPYFITLLKIYFIGLIVHLAFSAVPPIANRLSEFFLVVEFLLAPIMIAAFKEKAFGFISCVSIAAVFFVFGLHYTHLLNPYSIVSAW